MGGGVGVGVAMSPGVSATSGFDVLVGVAASTAVDVAVAVGSGSLHPAATSAPISKAKTRPVDFMDAMPARHLRAHHLPKSQEQELGHAESGSGIEV